MNPGLRPTFGRARSLENARVLLRAGDGDLYGEQWYTPPDQYLAVGVRVDASSFLVGPFSLPRAGLERAFAHCRVDRLDATFPRRMLM